MATESEPAAELTTLPCRFHRNKGMYVYTDGLNGGEQHEDYDNTIYWCFKTMKDFGPDDDLVERTACCDLARECYEAS